MKTKNDIDYQAAPYGHIATIPKGTEVTKATNLPNGGFWVKKWNGMTLKAKSWLDNYGFLLTNADVEE